jgi:acetyl esterase/lipase
VWTTGSPGRRFGQRSCTTRRPRCGGCGRAHGLGVDPARIAAWGESAGGSLAALLGLTGSELAGSELAGSELEGSIGVVGPSSEVTAVVAWYPPTDLPAIAPAISADPLAADSREAQLLGAPLPSVPQLAAQASPVSHVHAGAPPFLLLHGRDDRVIPCSQSKRLADLLRAADVHVEFESYDRANHMWLGAPEAAAQALEHTLTFLVAQLRP